MNKPVPAADELRYHLLRLLEKNPSLSQRGIATELGISLGKVNYCLRALIMRGFVKARNFKNNRNKVGYLYLLTPRGFEAKARIAYRFLIQRIAEVEGLQQEIAAMREMASRRKLLAADLELSNPKVE